MAMTDDANYYLYSNELANPTYCHSPILQGYYENLLKLEVYIKMYRCRSPANNRLDILLKSIENTIENMQIIMNQEGSAMITETKYIINTEDLPYLTDALRIIKRGENSKFDIILLSDKQFAAFKRAIPIAVEIPDKKEFVPQDHQRILKTFAEQCAVFIDYLYQYNEEDADISISILTKIIDVMESMIYTIIRHEPLGDNYNMEFLNSILKLNKNKE